MVNVLEEVLLVVICVCYVFLFLGSFSCGILSYIFVVLIKGKKFGDLVLGGGFVGGVLLLGGLVRRYLRRFYFGKFRFVIGCLLIDFYSLGCE